jgi:hypothetical protein
MSFIMVIEVDGSYADANVQRLMPIAINVIRSKTAPDGLIKLGDRERPYYEIPVGEGSYLVFGDVDLENKQISWNELTVSMSDRLSHEGGLSGMLAKAMKTEEKPLPLLFNEARNTSLITALSKIPAANFTDKMWLDIGSHDGSLAQELLREKNIKGVIGVDPDDHQATFQNTFRDSKNSFYVQKSIQELAPTDLNVSSGEIGGVLLINPNSEAMIEATLQYVVQHSLKEIRILCFVDDEFKAEVEKLAGQLKLQISYQETDEKSGVYILNF